MRQQNWLLFKCILCNLNDVTSQKQKFFNIMASDDLNYLLLRTPKHGKTLKAPSKKNCRLKIVFQSWKKFGCVKAGEEDRYTYEKWIKLKNRKTEEKVSHWQWCRKTNRPMLHLESLTIFLSFFEQEKSL